VILMVAVMNVMTPDLLEAERPYLFALAYRLLGSAADAEDVLQEAFLKARAVDDIRSPRALLTTIVTRLCLDEVRSARRRREEYVGPWLPEPIATGEPGADDRTIAAESMSMAFLVLLESLSPLERAVFVLREVLDLDFGEIAEAVGRSEAACRQLLHRAREHVAARPARFPVAPTAQRSLTAAFLTALGTGDLDGLMRLLTEDVAFTTDHGGKARANLRTVAGRDRVARLMAGLYDKSMKLGWAGVPTWLNGAPALLALEQGRVVSATVLELVDGGDGPRVANVHTVRNPDKLAGLDQALHAGRIALMA